MHGLWNMIAKAWAASFYYTFWNIETILHWKESGWIVTVQVQLYLQSSSMDKPSLNLFCSSPLFHFPGRKLLYGSILWVMCITRPLPVCKCSLSSQNGFTPHVLRDGGCSPFYPLFNGKICASDISKNWASAIEDGLCRRMNRWMSERKRKKRVERTGCADDDDRTHFDCFCECEWNLQCYKLLLNTDISTSRSPFLLQFFLSFTIFSISIQVQK